MTYQKISEKYDAWLMSNAKWRKVLSALSVVCDKDIDIEIKTIDSSNSFLVRPPRLCDINEKGFSDGAYQPFEYKWIEWLLVPRKQRVKAGVDFFRE